MVEQAAAGAGSATSVPSAFASLYVAHASDQECHCEMVPLRAPDPQCSNCRSFFVETVSLTRISCGRALYRGNARCYRWAIPSTIPGICTKRKNPGMARSLCLVLQAPIPPEGLPFLGRFLLCFSSC
jgi:hypothetical protein